MVKDVTLRASFKCKKPNPTTILIWDLFVGGSLNFFPAAFLWNSDLFTQEWVRMGQHLASRCLRRDFQHTMLRCVILLLQPWLQLTVNMWNSTHCQFLVHHNSFKLPITYRFPFPTEVPRVWLQRFRSPWFRSPWHKREYFFHFSHAVMGNKTPLSPQGAAALR